MRWAQVDQGTARPDRQWDAAATSSIEAIEGVDSSPPANPSNRVSTTPPQRKMRGAAWF